MNRFLIAAGAAASCVALAASAAISVADSPIGVAGCVNPAVKPKLMILANGDCTGRDLGFRKVKWTSYGGDTARATGLRDKYAFCKDKPKLCGGNKQGSVKVDTLRVTVRVSEKQFCPADANYPDLFPAGDYYTKVSWRVQGGAEQSARLTCSERPPEQF